MGALEKSSRDQGGLRSTVLALKGLTPALTQDIMTPHSGGSESLPANGRFPVPFRTGSRCRTAEETRATITPLEIESDSAAWPDSSVKGAPFCARFTVQNTGLKNLANQDRKRPVPTPVSTIWN